MKKIIFIILSIFISGCAINTYTTNELDNRLTLTIDDLDISPQFSAEAEVLNILGIDFARLFNKKTDTYGATTSSYGATTSSYSNKSIEYSIDAVGTTTSSSSNKSIESGFKYISFYEDIISRVLGPLGGSEASTYAFHNLLEAFPDYDFILYPKIEENTMGIPFLITKTKVKVTARLGKIKTSSNQQD